MKTNKNITQLTKLVNHNNKVVAKADKMGEKLYRLVLRESERLKEKAGPIAAKAAKPGLERLFAIFKKHNPEAKDAFVSFYDSRLEAFYAYIKAHSRNGKPVTGAKLVSFSFKIIDKNESFYDPENRKAVDLWPSKSHPDFAEARDAVNAVLAIYRKHFESPDIMRLEKLLDSIN